MESPQINRNDSEEVTRSASTSSSNQLFITENLDLPDDTFRMSLDYISVIGENVTIGDRDVSIDNSNIIIDTQTQCNTPVDVDSSHTPTKEKSPPILDTPKRHEDVKVALTKPNLLKLSLTKNIDDGFVKPSPVADVMSPAKMLQFEVDIANSATPTMKRAAIDFNFFNENNFEEYFEDVPKAEVNNEEKKEKAYKEIPVIVKADTVRHEIGYDRQHISITPPR
ncbi:unnamed protein product [Euphydryas editha]|uniref:Uncharacterized protein n=1 Tax=Euphydryas editha TaxID=104508 RepID=A0AAU9UJD9_EUPED|nr:unnamed protein product [Euphydryas editha]